MELQHLVAKIPVEGPLGIDPARVVDVFHQWVAKQLMPELLVDVAELLHVPDGPGVVAVGHEADYTLDHTDGIWGVLYRRKVAVDGSNADRIAQAFQSVGRAASLLEAEFSDGLKFSRTTLQLIVNDRALAPNTPETFAAARPEFEAALRTLLGHGDFTLALYSNEPRRRFGVSIQTARPFELATGAAAQTATV